MIIAIINNSVSYNDSYYPAFEWVRLDQDIVLRAGLLSTYGQLSGKFDLEDLSL